MEEADRKIRVMAKLVLVYDSMLKWNKENDRPNDPLLDPSLSCIEGLIHLVAGADESLDMEEFEKVVDDALELMDFRLDS